MQRIERYGVLALVFLLVTLVTFALWDDGSKDKGDELAIAEPDRNAVTAPETPAQRRQRVLAEQRQKQLERQAAERRQRDAAKANDLASRFESSKSASALSNKTKRGTSRTNTPAIAPVKKGYDLGISQPSETPGKGSRRPNVPADIQPAAGSATKETEAERKSRLIREMDRNRRQGEYTIKSGETLSQISLQELGTSKRWQEIVLLNPGLDPNRLVVGQKIQIPGDRTASKPSVATRTVEPAVQPKGPGGSYTIQSGDVLSRIAQDQLGSVKAVPDIIALNPGLDANNLRVGQVIAMPQGSAPAPRRTTTNTTKSAAKQDRPRVR